MIRQISAGTFQRLSQLDENARVRWILFCLFNFYLLFVVCLNTLWRDEGHAVLLIRESKNLQGFIGAMRFEGTPWLWHLLGYLAFQVTGDAYVALLGLHLFVWTLIAILVCYCLKLGNSLCAVILLSSAFTEYIENIRQYPLALLFAFSFAAVVIRQPRSIFAPLLLLLLAQTSVNSFLVSMGLFVWLIGHFWRDPVRSRNLLILGATVVVTIPQLISDSHVIAGVTGWRLLGYSELNHILLLFSDAALFGTIAGTLLGISTIWGGWRLYQEDRKELALIIFAFLLSLSGFLLLLCFKYTTSPRHHWLLSAMMVVLLVIGRNSLKNSFPRRRYFALLASVAMVLSIQATIANSIIFACQVKTQSQNVAAYLRANSIANQVLMYHETDCEGIMAYLSGRFRFYSLDRDSFIDRVRWDNEVVDFPAVRGVPVSTNISNLSRHLALLPPSLIASRPFLVVAGQNLKVENGTDPFQFSTPNCRVTIQRAFLFSRGESFLVYRVAPPGAPQITENGD